MSKQKWWEPKPGDFVRHKLRPGVKMLIIEQTADGWACRLLEDGKLKIETYRTSELEPW